MTTRAKTAKGLRVGVVVDNVTHYFQEVKSAPAIGESPTKVDVTHLESDSHEYIKDIPDFSGELAFVMNAQSYVESGTIDSGNLNLIEQLDKNGSYTFIVDYPMLNQSVSIPADWSYEIGAGSVSSPMEINLTLIPRGAPVFSPYGINSITISFNKNGGTGTMASQTVAIDAVYRAPACTFTPPSNKIFGSWNTASDGTGVSYNINDTVDLGSSDFTLYPVWVASN